MTILIYAVTFVRLSKYRTQMDQTFRSRIISFFLASFSASLLVRLAGLLASISCRSQNAASSA